MPSIKILLHKALEDLSEYDFNKFKMYLNTKISDRWKPIAKSLLESPSLIKAVETMVSHYGEESAASLTVEILRLIPNNAVADDLESALKGVETPAVSTSSAASTAAPTPAAAPASISAQAHSVVIAPTLIGTTSGAWNLTINK